MGARRWTAAAACALAAALALAGCGEAAPGGNAPPVFAAETPAAAPAVDETPAAEEPPAKVGLGDAPRHKASPSKSPTRKPKPRPSRKASAATEKPPTVKPKPAPSNCKPKYVGAQASRAEAKAALTEAAGRTYWPVSAPDIRVPLALVKATAWQESGWQSNIVACDGGIGLMQVMEATAGDVNRRFEQDYDVHDHRDNATLGANYLAWLIKYFGDVYFDGDYTLDAADCADHTDACLLNAVIASYNFGFGAVDTDDGLVIPNPRYVENVRALMTECVCLSY
jgi:soluble lytic murein transglycosylase-like protein